MSMCYYAIAGFGIKNVENYLSEEKIQALNEEMADMEADISEYAYEYYDANAQKSCFYFTDNGESEYYFLYTPSFYFKMTSQEKAFTCEEDIAIAMFEVLKDVLEDDVTVETFKQNIDWVSTYGAG